MRKRNQQLRTAWKIRVPTRDSLDVVWKNLSLSAYGRRFVDISWETCGSIVHINERNISIQLCQRNFPQPY